MSYGAFAVFTKTVPYLNSIAAPDLSNSTDANADLYAEGPFVREYAASAMLDLPPVSPERDSPSVQLGFFAPSEQFQGGLIRTPDSKFRLRAFVAYATAGAQNQIRYLASLPAGPHAVEIRVHDGNVTFFVDGRNLFETPQSTYVPAGSNPWLVIGTAVRYGGAYGTISDIRVRRDTDVALLSYAPACIVSNRGIHITPVRDHWVLGGAYSRSAEPAYQHCSGAFERHRKIANTSS